MEYKFEEEVDEIETDKYMQSVLHYIRDNPGRNENQIKSDLAKEGTCSELTTRRKIKRLLDLRLIEDRKIKNGFHKFYLSDRSEYNRIREILDSIWQFGNLLEDPRISHWPSDDAFGYYPEEEMDKLPTLPVPKKLKATVPEDQKYEPIYSDEGLDLRTFDSPFTAACHEMIDLMLSILLYQTNNGNLSKADSKTLSIQIVHLALKFKLQSFLDDETIKIKLLQDMQRQFKKLQILSKEYVDDSERYTVAKSALDELRICAESLKRSLV